MNSTFVIVQDFYKSILEKRASDGSIDSIMPDYQKDSREIALDEIEANKKDQRAELGKLLNAAKAEGSADTKELKKALPEAVDAHEVETSNPLVKIAMNKAFFDALRKVEFLKTASADYMKAVYLSFNDELEKIGTSISSSK